MSLDDAALLPQKLQQTGRFSIGTEWDAVITQPITNHHPELISFLSEAGAGAVSESLCCVQDEGSDWLCGMVDEFRAWDMPLQPAELSFFMKSAIADPAGQANMHLMAYLPFAEGKGATTADLSNSHLAPTLHGTTWVNTFTPYDTL